MSRALSLGAVLIVTAALAACIDASRINRSCQWTDGSAAKLDLRRATDREHLRQDAQVAWEIAQRYADVRYRTRGDLARPLLETCRAAMYDSIASRHAVTLADIKTATFARDWWIDIMLVFLPMIAITAAATELTAREIRRSVNRVKTRTIVLATFVVLVAMVATGFTQMWAMMLETWRLRNEHLAGRVFVVPSVAHRGIVLASLCLVAAVVVIRRSSRSAEIAH
jgi:outer membrane murein-binding lipoprotein Lpp